MIEKGKEDRRRLYVDLRAADEEALALVREAFGVERETEATRSLLQLFRRIADSIRSGQIVAFERADDPAAVDAFPELTRALRPEAAYDFLVRVAHPWRRQLYLKGRRMTVGALVGEMRANDWDVERAAHEYDLDPGAVREALHYAEHHRALIEAENSEEARRIGPHLHRAPVAG